MERKLVSQGENALTITLPAKWLKTKGLKAGNSVFVEEETQGLVVKTERTAARSEIEFDIRGCEKNLLFHVFQGAYVNGYDTIKIWHDTPQAVQEVHRLLGMTIAEHTSKYTVFKSVIAVPDEDFKTVLRRTGHILIQEAETLLRLAQGKAKLEEVNMHEELLNYSILYCMRYLNKYERYTERNFFLCSTIETAGDQIYLIAKHIGKDAALAKKIFLANAASFPICFAMRYIWSPAVSMVEHKKKFLSVYRSYLFR
jgi:phosphate uptake regulator